MVLHSRPKPRENFPCTSGISEALIPTTHSSVKLRHLERITGNLFLTPTPALPILLSIDPTPTVLRGAARRSPVSLAFPLFLEFSNSLCVILPVDCIIRDPSVRPSVHPSGRARLTISAPLPLGLLHPHPRHRTGCRRSWPWPPTNTLTSASKASHSSVCPFLGRTRWQGL